MSQTVLGPTIKRGKSKQDYRTPSELIRAVEKRFGPLVFDLAADSRNTQAPEFFSLEDDSLRQDWETLTGNLWLNPPFADIEPWASKCACTTVRSRRSGIRNRILFLVPASVGSEWYRSWVQKYAYVLALSPRLTFDGCTTPYPKDCILAVYSEGFVGFDTWRWDKE